MHSLPRLQWRRENARNGRMFCFGKGRGWGVSQMWDAFTTITFNPEIQSPLLLLLQAQIFYFFILFLKVGKNEEEVKGRLSSSRQWINRESDEATPARTNFLMRAHLFFGEICVRIWIVHKASCNPPTCPLCRGGDWVINEEGNIRHFIALTYKGVSKSPSCLLLKQEGEE